MRADRTLLGLVLLCLAAPGALAAQTAQVPPPLNPGVPAHGVIGMEDPRRLTAEFWIDQAGDAERVVMSPEAIDAQNRKLFRLDPTMNDLAALPESLDRKQVLHDIDKLSTRPNSPLYDVEGRPVPTATIDALVQALDRAALAERTPLRYGLVLRRTALRSFPTSLRVFSTAGETDIDRFQESALFPGTPVAIVHRSADQEWLWVVSPRYRAWVAAADIVEGDRQAVLGYAARSPHRVITGAKVSTVFTREQPALSELQLDMGVRVPLAGVAADALVNGQHSYASWAVELPVRGPSGSLLLAPALIQKNHDTSDAHLSLTRANLIRQAFKFLGERYGWGHSYNGRDCSGFVSEVYRSMGVELPRNTRDQAFSPALEHVRFDGNASAAARRKAVDKLEVGDLIYIPGHVMMMIGRDGGVPYVIHDTNGGSYLGADGKLRSMQLNSVSVTPLLPLRFSREHSYVDRITSIVRIRP
ncbi:MAG: NlpC-P60 family protein [Lysobacteraceae bacterium]|nr:MAG: NlpC-P60 family protein [Xanthomonadaceae bacterium]